MSEIIDGHPGQEYLRILRRGRVEGGGEIGQHQILKSARSILPNDLRLPLSIDAHVRYS